MTIFLILGAVAGLYVFALLFRLASYALPVAEASQRFSIRLENRVLREEREVLKKATQFFASQRP